MPEEPLITTEFMKPIVTGWLGKINLAIKHKKPFSDVAEQCMGFFSGDIGFMWSDKFRSKFMKGGLAPKFKMTMCKAFELVALFGPVLYWKNPQRRCQTRKPLELTPDLFGDDQNAMFMFQQQQQEQQQWMSKNRIRAQLMERYLNYTPGEMPGGGLSEHAQQAITEALVKGRGCLWTEPYEFPGSKRSLTGCFYDTVDNLLIDPDAESLDDAKWIARRCVHPVWQVEREYNLPEGALTNKGNLESGNSQGESEGNDFADYHRKKGETFDLLVYYKIWSKGGVGARLTGVTTELKDSFDRVVGDYAYLVVAPNVPFPLNAPKAKIATALDEDVQRMFQWPIPYWTDDRWPVCVLDFYREPRNAWPIAPLKPGLGELTFMNVIVSHLANRIWSSSRDFLAILKSAATEVKDKILNGEDLAVIELNEIHGSITDVVQFLQHPPTNFDAWRILDRVSEIFDKRVGLSELLYALNPGDAQSRSAMDASTKQSAASVRPEYMAGRVEDWMSECARQEKFCARWFIEASDVQPLLGQTGAYLWEQHVTNVDPEIVIREMDATVEAGSVRKPNKERDQQNLNTIMPTLAPMLSAHADVTGDTRPLNALLKQWGEAIEQPMDALQMGPRTPMPPPPEVQQQMQQEQQMQQQEHAAELQGKQMDLQAKVVDAQAKAQQAEMDAKQKQAEMVFKMLEMRQKGQEFQQGLYQKAEEHQLDLQMQQRSHSLNLIQQRQKGQQDIQIAKAKARATPRPSANGAKT